MRTLTPTLLAAATSGRGRPWVSADVEDHRCRWQTHATGASSTRPTDMGSMGDALVRAAMVGSQVRWAAIPNADNPATWPGAWRVIAGDADGSEDVSLAVYGDDRASVFYLQGTGHLARVDTADGGDTWGAPQVCRAWDYTPVRIAADGIVCAWSRPGEIRLATTRDDLGNPAWLAEVVHPGAGSFVHCRGLALCRDCGDARTYYVVAAVDGALLITTYDEPSKVFGRTYQIVPPGTAGVGSTSQVRDPSVLSTPNGLYITYVDRVGTGDVAYWEQTTVLHTRTYPHFARVALLDMGQSTPARAALGPLDDTLYAACENNVCRSTCYAAGRDSHNTRTLIPSAYSVETREASSVLTLTIPNVGHVYDAAGQAGTPYEALRPGATLLLHRGYITSSGPETLTLAPHVIRAVRLVSRRDRSILELRAECGLDLLRAQHPADVSEWRSESIRHLLGQISGMAGLAYSDAGEDALGVTLGAFVLHPTDTLYGALTALLHLAGAVAFVGADGTLTARVLGSYAPEALTLTAGPILWHESETLAPRLVDCAVYGDGAAACSAADANTMDTGLLLSTRRVDYRATTQALAATLAEHTAERADMARRVWRVAIPLRPDVEMWDRVERTGASIARVIAVTERYDAREGVYETVVEAQG